MTEYEGYDIQDLEKIIEKCNLILVNKTRTNSNQQQTNLPVILKNIQNNQDVNIQIYQNQQQNQQDINTVNNQSLNQFITESSEQGKEIDSLLACGTQSSQFTDMSYGLFAQPQQQTEILDKQYLFTSNSKQSSNIKIENQTSEDEQEEQMQMEDNLLNSDTEVKENDLRDIFKSVQYQEEVEEESKAMYNRLNQNKDHISQQSNLTEQLITVCKLLEEEKQKNQELNQTIDKKEVTLKEMTDIQLEIEKNLEYMQKKFIQRIDKDNRNSQLKQTLSDKELKLAELQKANEKLSKQNQYLQHEVKQQSKQNANNQKEKQHQSQKLSKQQEEGQFDNPISEMQGDNLQFEQNLRLQSQLIELEKQKCQLISQNAELKSRLDCKEEFLSSSQNQINQLKDQIQKQGGQNQVCQKCHELNTIINKDQNTIKNQINQISHLQQTIDSFQQKIESLEFQNHQLRKGYPSSEIQELQSKIRNLEIITSPTNIPTHRSQPMSKSDCQTIIQSNFDYLENRKQNESHHFQTSAAQQNPKEKKRKVQKSDIKQILKLLGVRTLQEAVCQITNLQQINQEQQGLQLLQNKLREMILECSDPYLLQQSFGYSHSQKFKQNLQKISNEQI